MRSLNSRGFSLLPRTCAKTPGWDHSLVLEWTGKIEMNRDGTLCCPCGMVPLCFKENFRTWDWALRYSLHSPSLTKTIALEWQRSLILRVFDLLFKSNIHSSSRAHSCPQSSMGLCWRCAFLDLLLLCPECHYRHDKRPTHLAACPG